LNNGQHSDTTLNQSVLFPARTSPIRYEYHPPAWLIGLNLDRLIDISPSEIVQGAFRALVRACTWKTRTRSCGTRRSNMVSGLPAIC